MIAIIDTNVLMSGVRPGASPPCVIVDRWYTREFDMALSEETYAEFLGILGREYWVAALANYADSIVQMIEQISYFAVFASEIPEIPVFLPDPKDTKFIALALAVDADYIVSGDKVLRAYGPYGRTPVITPREFLDILEAREKDAQTIAEGDETE